MKRLVGLLTVVIVVAMVMPAVAGEGHKCTASTQDCLNKMANSMNNRGWVGLEIDNDGGMDKMVVTKVVEGSPAEAAGFRTGVALPESDRSGRIRDVDDLEAG